MMNIIHALYYANTTLSPYTFTVTSILISVDWHITAGFGIAMLLIGFGIGFILRGHRFRSIKTNK